MTSILGVTGIVGWRFRIAHVPDNRVEASCGNSDGGTDASSNCNLLSNTRRVKAIILWSSHSMLSVAVRLADTAVTDIESCK